MGPTLVKFLHLHDLLGKVICINVNHIVYMEPASGNPDNTTVYLDSGNPSHITVKENLRETNEYGYRIGEHNIWNAAMSTL